MKHLFLLQLIVFALVGQLFGSLADLENLMKRQHEFTLKFAKVAE
jgi:hypothetical protein